MTNPPPPDILPPPYRGATGKGDLRIPGAGSIGMAILIISLSTLFISSIAAYLLIRSKTQHWPPPGFPAVPNSLWLSTLVILLSSFTMYAALAAIRHPAPHPERKLLLRLWLTFALGLLFLLLQIFNWFEFYSAIPAHATIQGAYLGMFYVLTALHAAHVLGGLIPMTIILHRARHARYSPNYHPGIRYLNAYWHFLDIIWIALFLVLYF